MISNLLLTYLLISLIILVVIGISIVIQVLFRHMNSPKRLTDYSFQLCSLMLAILLSYLYSDFFRSLGPIISSQLLPILLLILLAILPTSILVYKDKTFAPYTQFTCHDFLSGMSMEIPQRVLSQNLFFLIGTSTLIGNLFPLAVLLNAILWVQFIVLQEKMNKKNLSAKVLRECLASFYFSLVVGFLYYYTGNILLPMLAHGLERYTVYLLNNFRHHKTV